MKGACLHGRTWLPHSGSWWITCRSSHAQAFSTPHLLPHNRETRSYELKRLTSRAVVTTSFGCPTSHLNFTHHTMLFSLTTSCCNDSPGFYLQESTFCSICSFDRSVRSHVVLMSTLQVDGYLRLALPCSATAYLVTPKPTASPIS